MSYSYNDDDDTVNGEYTIHVDGKTIIITSGEYISPDYTGYSTTYPKYVKRDKNSSTFNWIIISPHRSTIITCIAVLLILTVILVVLIFSNGLIKLISLLKLK